MGIFPDFLAFLQPGKPFYLELHDAESRMYQHFYGLNVAVELYVLGLSNHTALFDKSQMREAAFGAKVFNLNMRLQFGSALQNALEPETAQPELVFGFERKEDNVLTAETKTINGNRIYHLVTNIAVVEFILYYEGYISRVAEFAKHDVKNYPPPWDFARVLRNSISHGRVNIRDENFKPVSWYALSYGPAENGRKIAHEDMVLPDIWLLMMEMDMALTNLGLTETDETLTFYEIPY